MRRFFGIHRTHIQAESREVSAGALDISSTEGTTNTGSFFVGRPERLPFPTRVFFNIRGTPTPAKVVGLPFYKRPKG